MDSPEDKDDSLGKKRTVFKNMDDSSRQARSSSAQEEQNDCLAGDIDDTFWRNGRQLMEARSVS